MTSAFISIITAIVTVFGIITLTFIIVDTINILMKRHDAD